MTQKRIRTFALLAALAGVISLAGCAKKVAKVTPPPAPAPAPSAPTATLAANPTVIQQGQSSVLTWQTSNASEITIAELGYSATHRFQISHPECVHKIRPDCQGRGRNKRSLRSRYGQCRQPRLRHLHPRMKNCSARTSGTFSSTTTNLQSARAKGPPYRMTETFLSQHANIKVLVEGHCDDRGSEEYNLALGASRAEIGEAGTRAERSSRRSNTNGQLRKGKTVRHRGQRTVLATEQGRPFRI